MMQELKRLHWCDVCHADNGAKEEAVGRYLVNVQTVGATRGIARMLELCDIHAKPVEEMREILRTCGTPPRDERADEEGKSGQPELPFKTRRVDCPVCGKNLSSSGAIYHLVHVHDVKAIKHPKKCPDCGKRIEIMAVMASHRSAAHGFETIEAMMAQHEGRA